MVEQRTHTEYSLLTLKSPVSVSWPYARIARVARVSSSACPSPWPTGRHVLCMRTAPHTHAYASTATRLVPWTPNGLDNKTSPVGRAERSAPRTSNHIRQMALVLAARERYSILQESTVASALANDHFSLFSCNCLCTCTHSRAPSRHDPREEPHARTRPHSPGNIASKSIDCYVRVRVLIDSHVLARSHTSIEALNVETTAPIATASLISTPLSQSSPAVPLWDQPPSARPVAPRPSPASSPVCLASTMSGGDSQGRAAACNCSVQVEVLLRAALGVNGSMD